MKPPNTTHISIKCGGCGQAETVSISKVPTRYIKAEIEFDIGEMTCDKCDYEGEPEETELIE